MTKTALLISAIMLTSCISALLNENLEKAGVFDDKVRLQRISNDYKNVIFIGIHHIGRKEYYNDVAFKVDSIQRQGYVVFYEKVKKSVGIDSISNDIDKKKFRKITGLTNSKFYDSINHIIGGKLKYKGDYKLTNQPTYSNLKVNMETAKNVDVELNDLIRGFELKHETILLDNCDKITKSDSSVYDCDGVKHELAQIFKNEFLIAFRDRNLANELNNSDQRNILVIYGNLHYDGLITELQILDKNWK